MQRSKLTALALLVAVFLAGGVAGWFTHGLQNDRDRAGRRDPRRLVQRMAADLNLSQVQQDSVLVILERSRTEMNLLWQEMHPRYDAVRARTRSEIERHLDPGQIERYRAMEAERDRRRARADSLRGRTRGAQ